MRFRTFWLPDCEGWGAWPQGCGCLSSADEPRGQQLQQQALTCHGPGAGWRPGSGLQGGPWASLLTGSSPAHPWAPSLGTPSYLVTSIEAHLCRRPCWGLGRFRGSSIWGASWVCDVQLRPGFGTRGARVWVSPGLGPLLPGGRPTLLDAFDLET